MVWHGLKNDAIGKEPGGSDMYGGVHVMLKRMLAAAPWLVVSAFAYAAPAEVLIWDIEFKIGDNAINGGTRIVSLNTTTVSGQALFDSIFSPGDFEI